jgi:hypothetical protein
MKSIPSIMDVQMQCTKCGTVNRLGDCEPCIDPDGNEGTGFGCPVNDCGGYVVEKSVNKFLPKGGDNGE